jgi:hypothetical protein
MLRTRLFRPLVLLTALVGTLALTAMPPAQASTTDGIADATWQTNGSVFATVQYQTATYGTVLIVGGDFTSIRTTPNGTKGTTYPANNLGAIQMSTGQFLTSFRPDVEESDFTPSSKGGVQALALVGDTLYVGGQFTSIDGAAHYNIAAMDLDPTTMTGTVDPTFNATVGVPGASNANTFFVYKILPGPSGLYVGGAFSKVDGHGVTKLALLNWDGSYNKTFHPTKVNGAVRDMAWSSDGATIFVAGAFSSFDCTNPSPIPPPYSGCGQSIVRINPQTGARDAWSIPIGDVQVGGPTAKHFGMTCWSLAVTPTGETPSRLFAGCGMTPNYVAAYRLDNGNSGNRVWSFGTSGNDQAIALTPNGQSLVFGGHFGTYLTMQVCGNKYLKNLGVLHNIELSSPSLDCGFLPQFWGPDPFGGVWEIQVTSTQIWAGGMFTMVNCDMTGAHPGQPASVGCPNGVGQRSVVRFSGPVT